MAMTKGWDPIMEVIQLCNSKILDWSCQLYIILGPPVEVGVTMYIIGISSVSEVQMVDN